MLRIREQAHRRGCGSITCSTRLTACLPLRPSRMYTSRLSRADAMVVGVSQRAPGVQRGCRFNHGRGVLTAPAFSESLARCTVDYPGFTAVARYELTLRRRSPP